MNTNVTYLGMHIEVADSLRSQMPKDQDARRLNNSA